jgi:hypothetical protein
MQHIDIVSASQTLLDFSQRLIHFLGRSVLRVWVLFSTLYYRIALSNRIGSKTCFFSKGTCTTFKELAEENLADYPFQFLEYNYTIPPTELQFVATKANRDIYERLATLRDSAFGATRNSGDSHRPTLPPAGCYYRGDLK